MITIPPLPWLYDAVSWILLRFHDLFSLVFPSGSGAAWGLAIVGLVVVIRIALLPLFAKQIKAQRGLQALQPQMKAIQKKYANDKRAPVPGADEALQGDRHQPAVELPADPGPVAVLLRALHRAQPGRPGQHRRGDDRRPTSSR